jgi:hypothetical protein
MILKSQTDLSDVVPTRHTACGFASRLNGGQQQSDQNSDDGDHNQQLNEREPLPRRVDYTAASQIQFVDSLTGQWFPQFLGGTALTERRRRIHANDTKPAPAASRDEGSGTAVKANAELYGVV